MSEFKAGSHFVLKDRFSINQIFRIFSIGRNIVGTKVYQVLDGGGWPEYCVRHATPEEIAAGHRIDFPTLPKPVGSLQELHPEFAKVLHENFLELLGDDFPIENHISPNCKVEDV